MRRLNSHANFRSVSIAILSIPSAFERWLFPEKRKIGWKNKWLANFWAVKCAAKKANYHILTGLFGIRNGELCKKKSPDSENRVPREPFSSPSPRQLVELPARYAIQKMMSHGLFLPFHEKRSMIVFPSLLWKVTNEFFSIGRCFPRASVLREKWSNAWTTIKNDMGRSMSLKWMGSDINILFILRSFQIWKH